MFTAAESAEVWDRRRRGDGLSLDWPDDRPARAITALIEQAKRLADEGTKPGFSGRLYNLSF